MLLPMSNEDLGEARVFGNDFSPWFGLGPFDDPEEDQTRVPLNLVERKVHVECTGSPPPLHRGQRERLQAPD